MKTLALITTFLASALISVKGFNLTNPELQKDLGYAIIEGQSAGLAYNSWLGVRYGSKWAVYKEGTDTKPSNRVSFYRKLPNGFNGRRPPHPIGPFFSLFL